MKVLTDEAIASLQGDSPMRLTTLLVLADLLLAGCGRELVARSPSHMSNNVESLGLATKMLVSSIDSIDERMKGDHK
jgi:hypothetical protein